jgi:hypothetical protein
MHFRCSGDDQDASVVGPDVADKVDSLTHNFHCPMLATAIELPPNRTLCSTLVDALASNNVAITKALLAFIALAFHLFNVVRNTPGVSIAAAVRAAKRIKVNSSGQAQEQSRI